MTDAAAPPGGDARRRPAVIVALGVVAFIGERLHVLDDDFPNPDIAGIVYNAELLLRGGLPYVDTVEIKPPGAFELAALSIAMLGRSLESVQLVYALWLLVGAWAVAWAAQAVYADDGATRRESTAIAAMVALVAMGMFSYNYSGWMTPASAIAVGAALRGLRSARWPWSVLAGAAACLALVTIQRAAVLALVLPIVWLWARRQKLPGASWTAVLAWIVGALAMAVVVAMPWIAAGRLGTLIAALAPWSVARDYGSASSGGAAVVPLVAWQLLEVFWFPLGVIAIASFAATRERARGWAPWIPGVAWLSLSIVAAGIGGMRFYLHYLVQYAPALGLLAGHPALMRRVHARDRVVGALLAALVLAQLVEIGLGRGHRYESMARRLQNGRTAAQAAGAHIRERTPASATVMAWGWTAWPIYYWSERSSATRVYKDLGTLTTFNTNTEFGSGAGPVFRPGPIADEVIADFDREPPAYFVYSPSMVDAFGARPDPLEHFTQLRERLAADYVLEAQYGDLRLLRRRE
jgi:hypothetical protein